LIEPVALNEATTLEALNEATTLEALNEAMTLEALNEATTLEALNEATTLDPGLRRDDGDNFTVATTTTVIPAHAGIQRRSNFRSLDF
jgi:hypothetical protein